MTAANAAHLSVVPAGPQPERKRPALGGTWTADKLMGAEFPPPAWAVPGILPEGLTLLAGAPKVGKSWLSLGLGLAVASGGMALDSIPVQAGPVLYLALEDTPRRLQSRMGRILGGQPAPAGLTLATECPPLRAGGAQAIADWIKANRGARMVVIDVFAKVRGNNAPGISPYEADYAAMTPAKMLADRFGIAVVLVHHVRKAASEDFLAEVSGTNGLAGAADTTIVLKRGRGQADGVLHTTGRDVDEAEYALSFHAAAGAWQLLDGPAVDHTLSDTRSAILRHLRQHGQAQPPKAVAEATSLAYDTVKRTCLRMAADGQLISDASGRYGVPADGAPAVPRVPRVPQSGLTSGNETDHGGHRSDHAVPRVPHVRQIDEERSTDA
ncbi:AAA family ATPase [Catellatospora paridis]|uniref:AAA family ATPase n=1 Tax=Catellatospora paridis TaxID=1617086 RepID=UPI0012D4873F|nr:AAA family ATPase [Catellatospora paridis]